jgi:hypothetical protein
MMGYTTAVDGSSVKLSSLHLHLSSMRSLGVLIIPSPDLDNINKVRVEIARLQICHIDSKPFFLQISWRTSAIHAERLEFSISDF